MDITITLTQDELNAITGKIAGIPNQPSVSDYAHSLINEALSPQMKASKAFTLAESILNSSPDVQASIETTLNTARVAPVDIVVPQNVV